MPPRIHDRSEVRRIRERAHRLAKPGCDFLLDIALRELSDRLSVVQRNFDFALDLSGHGIQSIEMLNRAENVERIISMHPSCPDLDRKSKLYFTGDEEAIAIPLQSMDLVFSALNLQWVNDLPGTLVQIRQILRPDGLFLAALPGGQTLTELRQCFAQAESEILGGIFPHISPMLDIKDAGALLQRAGFALPVVDQDLLTVRYDTMFALVADLRAMGATNTLVGKSTQPIRRDVAKLAAEIYQSRFSDDDGRIRASFQILWLCGWAPHESQQKPLRPGSAEISLSQIFTNKNDD